MQNLFKELHVAIYMVRKNFRNEMQLRASFAIQVFGMMVNNIAFIVSWVLFFRAFGEINGWGAIEVVALQGFLALMYGLGTGIFGGFRDFADVVHTGALDGYLLSPRSLYLRIAARTIKVSAVGDVFFGVVVLAGVAAIIPLNVMQILTMLALIIPSSLIMLNMLVISRLVAFFFADAREVANSLFEVFLSPSLYPGGLFTGALRVVYTFIIPALAVGGLPVEIIQNPSWLWIGIIWVMGIFWTLAAIRLLGTVRKRYESGNLVGARVN